ncbi:serine/threonine-protein kinase [Halocella sp. SP3-1]|uniref:serine/threonine-protein kinase n=1 Tax=Halocella sp. SP3-1 TaxID=2382161 RepID=UPI000F75EB4A|nr:serine/threonine-protein kinase [Halocella sp. SP3-1]AZO95789.1 serine/threonine protein kinase [Halocella sp. SP3-1]
MGEVYQEIDYLYLPENTFLKNREYRVLRKLKDRSNLSIVYLGLNKSGERVVIKEYFPKNLVLRDIDGINVICRSNKLKDKYKRAKRQFIKEAQIMSQFKNNPYICNCNEYFQENSSVYIIMKYYAGQTLEDIINNKEICFDEFLRKLFIPILDAANAIHAKGYIHRDIKPNNIIINQAKPVIIDFGSAVEYKCNKKKKILLTPGFSPIEFYSEKTRQGPYSDIYSLAAILYYFLSDTIPIEANERIIEDNLEHINQLTKEKCWYLGKLIMNNLSLDYKKRCRSIKGFKFLLLVQFFKDKIKQIKLFNKK